MKKNPSRRAVRGALPVVFALCLGGLAPAPATADPLGVLGVTLEGPGTAEVGSTVRYGGIVRAADTLGLPLEVELLLDGVEVAATTATLDGSYATSVTFGEEGTFVLRAVILRGTPLETWSDLTVVVLAPSPILFSRATVADQGVWSVMPDGSGLTQVHFGYAPNQISWAPGRDRFVMGAYGRVITMAADGSDERWLTSRFSEAWPAWSPDGSTIAYVDSDGGTLDPYVGTTQIWLMDADGANKRMVTAMMPNVEGAGPHLLDWSPDGTKIAFTASDYFGEWILLVLDLSDGSITDLTAPHHQAREPSWSPDGSTIAYMVPIPGANQLWLMDADGTNRRELLDESYGVSHPDWSPSGDRLALAGGGLFVYDLNTEELTQITSGFDLRPAW